LNVSSGLLQDDSLDFVSDIISHVPFFSPLTGHSNSVPILTGLSTLDSTGHSISVLIGLSSPSAKIVPTFDRPSGVDISSHLSCLPIWDTKTLEYVVLDVNDVSSG
jgi:hypothetical protein